MSKITTEEIAETDEADKRSPTVVTLPTTDTILESGNTLCMNMLFMLLKVLHIKGLLRLRVLISSLSVSL